MALPWLIGIGVAAVGAAILASDDDSDKKSSRRDDEDEELKRDRDRREREKRLEEWRIQEQADEYAASRYEDFLSPLVNAHMCKTVEFESSYRVHLEGDLDDDYLESDIELFGLSSELDYEKLEIIFDDLDDIYGDFSEVTGSIAQAHHRLTGEYLSLTKAFEKNLKLVYKINKARHKILDVLEYDYD